MSFPVDDATLLALEHALGASQSIDEQGTSSVLEADYNIPQLLAFLAGPNEEEYSRDDVILALIEEIKRLRK